jgi:acetyl-CoA carboxylase biotin carboxyl carrier protein
MSDQPVDINLQELRELIKLLKENNVSEFELRRADYRLRIRHGAIVEASSVTASLSAAPVNGREEGAAVIPPAPVPAPATPEEPEEQLHEVRSPMVGTFYRSSSPGAGPFVEAGDIVRKNQVLCIIEAMKIMNEIESDVEGEVRKIHVSNGQPVEFGELLFTVKPI